jgi:hypothetical protein
MVHTTHHNGNFLDINNRFLVSENGVSLQMVIESLVIWPGGAVGVNATMVITSISWDIAPKTMFIAH